MTMYHIACEAVRVSAMVRNSLTARATWRKTGYVKGVIIRNRDAGTDIKRGITEKDIRNAVLRIDGTGEEKDEDMVRVLMPILHREEEVWQMDGGKVYLELPKFNGENVPITVAARVMKKDPQFIRQGIVLGLLKFGVAFKKDGSSQYDYYISPIKLWEETGYVYQGEAE